ncbi:MAG TPA: metalloregulator ArsR/SmtB family transcription factor [Kofleriaceae bacterium]|nr:metalloregulator ArsR/SmtB family transcription factor [Kofleriaceae bacterium]
MSTRSLTTAARAGAPIFAALGDETRLRIVAKLSGAGALSIARLTDGEDITRQAITKHLAVLADAGLVRDVWHGRERRWQLELAPLATARTYLDLVSERWDGALARLAALVETDD